VPLSLASVPVSQRSEPSLGSTKSFTSASPAPGIKHSAVKVTPSTVPTTVGVGLALAAAS
jgi:hypothetical protein